MIIKLPQAVVLALQHLNQHGYQAYAVGGCIRDQLLGIEPNDWDICTNALPEEMLACFSGEYPVYETGLKHGTLTVRVLDMLLEITTFRVDGEYTDHRRPDQVTFTSNLEQDLARRDFTINAMAYHPEMGLQDPFEGRMDLNKKLIRCVGNARQRFEEDALRMLRGLRFAATLGYQMEEQTKLCILQQYPLLNYVAKERITAELNRLLLGTDAVTVLREYAAVFTYLIPEIKPMIGFEQHNPHHCYDVWEHTLHALSGSERVLPVRWAVLLHDIGKPHTFTCDEHGIGHFYGHPKYSEELTRQILQRLRMDHQMVQTVSTLVRYHDVTIEPSPHHIKRWLNRLGEEVFFLLLQVKWADASGQGKLGMDRLELLRKLEQTAQEIIQQRQCFSLKDLAVNGDDLIRLGVPQGKEIRTLLNFLLDQVIEEKLHNQQDHLLAAAKKYIRSVK